MKPFLPQLQTTFIKALHDPTALVRNNAALALGKLMALTVRVDPLLNELLAGVSATEVIYFHISLSSFI
jgi:vesicle coat complex subunit